MTLAIGKGHKHSYSYTFQTSWRKFVYFQLLILNLTACQVSSSLALVSVDHQKLTEKLGVNDCTKCHHLGGMYSISPSSRMQSINSRFSASGNLTMSMLVRSTWNKQSIRIICPFISNAMLMFARHLKVHYKDENI